MAARFASRAARMLAAPVARRVAVAGFAGVTAATMMATPVVACESPAAIPFTGAPGTKHERSFIALKPDAVERHLIGEIIARFEAKGYKLVAMKLLKPTKEMAASHYSDLAGKPFFPGLVDFFSSGPIVAMVWEGQDVIKGGRKLMGTTNPADSLPGTIRGDFSIVTGRNIIHGSDGPDSAAHEISNWFKPEELVTYSPADAVWVYEK